MKKSCFILIFGSIFITSSSLAYGITPVKISLDRATNSQDIEINNDNPTEKLRLQIDTYTWQQNSKGEALLSPTREVVAFPALLEIPANTKRTVRVGVRVPPGVEEKTYRVIVKQLRNSTIGQTADVPQRQSALSFLLNMSLPVYVNPINVSKKAELGSRTLMGGKLRFTIANTGNVRIEPGEASLKALTADGAVVGNTKIALGSILANVKREFILDLPQSQCEKIRSITIDATNPKDISQRIGNLKTTVSTPSGVCYRAGNK
jgi:fimbrial chaperone protein